MRDVVINTKEEYDKVQNELLAKGYEWITGDNKYYDLFECAIGFFKMRFVIHEENKTFEWRFLTRDERKKENDQRRIKNCNSTRTY